LIETIPDFHHTPKRFAALQQAIEADICNRARLAKAEIEFALRQEAIVGVLIELQNRGEIPEKVTHNDTKINNVLLDDATGQGICVIDLDTVMPGLSLYDFGDMVRTATCLAAEDEPDLAKIRMEMPIFKSLVQGFLEAARESLNQTEKDYLVFSGKLITFEIGIRFLTDYLTGDSYFKIHREGHNLDRCRTQFELVRSIEAQEDEMTRVVGQLST
jgi:thiamine kinase-like enzyme